VGVNLDPSLLPVDADLEMFCREYNLDPYEFVLSGGEDYELAFAVSPDDIDEILHRFRREFHTPIHIVGSFTDAWRGVRVAGEESDIEGFDHFR